MSERIERSRNSKSSLIYSTNHKENNAASFFADFSFWLFFFSVVGCKRIDQAFEAVEKAKALKSDIEKTVSQSKKDLTDMTEEIKKKGL